ncbi:MAG: hypothetical protein NTU47_10865 [Ignavibacteriales bacterium]|nr:hypothetical protein [Ignavibacteriales bacterium]
MAILRDTILPYSSIILDCFDSHTPVLECARQLKEAGLQFSDKIDLAKESEFLETVKEIALEAALKDNKDVKPSEFAIDFLLIMNGRMELNRKAFGDLIVGIDSVLNHDVKATRDVKGGLRTAIVYIKKSYPSVLTWLPLKYQQFVRTFRGV